MLTPIVLDFETYWSADHSLSKMSGIEYVMHPDTEIQSCSIQIGLDGTPKTYFGIGAIAVALDAIDWDNAWAIAHNNSEFDAMILAWRIGVKPKMWGCTLAMARPLHTKTCGVSLAKLAKHYNLRDKGSLVGTGTKGKRLAEFTPHERRAMEIYNNIDTEVCADLFKILVRLTPRDELRLIDMTIRMLVEPQFEVNVDLLTRGLRAERIRKKNVLQDLIPLLVMGRLQGRVSNLDVDLADGDPLTIIQSELKSPVKFRKMLEALGITVPLKTSPSTGRRIPALAKNDQGFLALRDHPNELVVAAVDARLDTQSSILETRMDRFIKVAECCDYKMPIALRYCGADTTGRWSGTMKLNQQNLTRVNPRKAKISDCLRKSLVAPAGHKVVVADLSGIELRINMFLWKVAYAMKAFLDDPEADLYTLFAARNLYNLATNEITKQQRHIGKTAHLGLGFGAGYVTFMAMAKTMGGVDMVEQEACRIVSTYRNTHHKIQQGWRTCHTALDAIACGLSGPIDPWGLCVTCPEGIQTPKGVIRYPDLRQERDKESGKLEWVYGHRRNKARIYAGKVDENIVQHLARHVISDIALAVDRDIGKHYPLAHTVHDELIYVVKDCDAQDVLDTVQGHMRAGVDWWPELITWSEGDIAQTYGDAK